MTMPNTKCIECGRELDAFIDGYVRCADVFACTDARLAADAWLDESAALAEPFDFEEGAQAARSRVVEVADAELSDALNAAPEAECCESGDCAACIARVEADLEAKALMLRGAFVNPPRPSRHERAPTQTYSEKVKHVRASGQSRAHTCHWPSCTEQVPPAMWGCRLHWYRLPKQLRDEIWRTYQVGQEISMRPSRAYLDVAQRVQTWIEDFLTREDRSTRYVAPRGREAELDAQLRGCTRCNHPECEGRGEMDCWRAVGENPPAMRYGFDEDEPDPHGWGG